MMIYPWQEAQWEQFVLMRQAGRLPHAILLSGLAGLGKLEFAKRLAEALFCQQCDSQGVACGQCRQCQFNKAGTHPDIRILCPEKTGQAIKVDQVREVNEFVQQSALQGGVRVVLIHPANKLNVNAANALLKTLEEPPVGAYIILLSDEIRGLLPTIVSRCQRINFTTPAREHAIEWLKSQEVDQAELLLGLAGGAPLEALALQDKRLLQFRRDFVLMLKEVGIAQQDVVQQAARFKDGDPLAMIDMMLGYVADLLKCQLGVEDIRNHDVYNDITQMANKLDRYKCLQFISYLMQVRKILLSGVALNKQIVLEDLLFRWSKTA